MWKQSLSRRTRQTSSATCSRSRTPRQPDVGRHASSSAYASALSRSVSFTAGAVRAISDGLGRSFLPLPSSKYATHERHGLIAGRTLRRRGSYSQPESVAISVETMRVLPDHPDRKPDAEPPEVRTVEVERIRRNASAAVVRVTPVPALRWRPAPPSPNRTRGVKPRTWTGARGRAWRASRPERQP